MSLEFLPDNTMELLRSELRDAKLDKQLVAAERDTALEMKGIILRLWGATFLLNNFLWMILANN